MSKAWAPAATRVEQLRMQLRGSASGLAVRIPGLSTTRRHARRLIRLRAGRFAAGPRRLGYMCRSRACSISPDPSRRHRTRVCLSRKRMRPWMRRCAERGDWSVQCSVCTAFHLPALTFVSGAWVRRAEMRKAAIVSLARTARKYGSRGRRRTLVANCKFRSERVNKEKYTAVSCNL